MDQCDWCEKWALTSTYLPMPSGEMLNICACEAHRPNAEEAACLWGKLVGPTRLVCQVCKDFRELVSTGRLYRTSAAVGEAIVEEHIMHLHKRHG